MEPSKWFAYQLRSTLDGFVWAVQQVPTERLYAVPPTPLGEWTAAQHIFHMLDYEESLALPTMHQWLGASPVTRAENRQSGQGLQTVAQMLLQFEQVRESEINLLPTFKAADWNSVQKTTFWGEVSLHWLISKTYQHTLEHTHDVLRLALFWDRILERMAHG